MGPNVLVSNAVLGVSLAVASALFVATVATTSVAAADLPNGMEETVLLVGSDFNAGVNQFAFLPDGTIFIASKYGHLWTYDGDDLTFIDILPTSFNFHRGVLGLRVDPDYENNQRLWFYYTTPAPARNRLSHFTFTGTGLIDETVVVDGPLLSLTSGSHGGGGLGFASDGTIFLTMGDDEEDSLFSQDPFDLRGSVIHVNQDGSPASNNPFLDGVAGDPRVFALGLRQPYRLAVQPGADNVFIGDVGANAFEEVNVAVPGANFGWAFGEGPVSDPALTSPSWKYINGGTGCIIAGDFAEPGDLAPQYEGDFFYGEYSITEIRRVILDESNVPIAEEVFAGNLDLRPVSVQFGPDGALYYLTWGTSELRRISYSPHGNEQPVAVAGVTPDHGAAPLAVAFDGTGSSDPDDPALTYDWDFGDGNFASGPTANHDYPAGEYEAKLTVTDDGNGEDSTIAIRVVSGNHRPVPAVTNPADESDYDAGETIAFDGSASDIEDGSLACADFSWRVIFHHSGHASLAQGPNQGSCAGSYEIPLVTDTDPDQWYEIRLDVADSGIPVGAELEGRQSIEIRPNTSVVSFATSPQPDLQLTLDGAPFAAPADVTGIVNQLRTIGAVDGQLHADGHTYSWRSWSDGGGIEHEVNVPDQNTTLTASFGCDVLVEVGPISLDSPAGDEVELSWPAVTDPCLVSGPGRYRVYAGSAAKPQELPADFPNDPGFTLVGSTSAESFVYTPDADHRYFLVIATGSDLAEGPLGHYGE